MSGQQAILDVRGLTVTYPGSSGFFRRSSEPLTAVKDVSFDIAPGETLGLVGESGCGKTSVARAVTRLVRPAAGEVLFQGVDLTTLDRRAMARVRAELQIVFQNPYSAWIRR